MVGGRFAGFGVGALVVLGDDELFQDRVELFKTQRRIREGLAVRSVGDMPG